MKIVCCLILISILSARCQRNYKSDMASHLPRFQTKNARGEEINSRDLLGRYTLITFIDPSKKRDLDICRDIWKNEGGNLNLIVISQRDDVPPELEAASSAQIIYDRDKRLANIFNAPFPGIYYFYDPTGKLLGAGNNQAGYHEGPKILFAWHLHHQRFRRSMFIPVEQKKISEYPWLAQLGRAMAAIQKPFYLFGLFSSVCDGCSSGRTILMLSKIQSEAAEKLDVRIILSPVFEEIDVARLTTQLRLSFPIELADHNLSEKRNDLNSTFRPSEINEFVFLVDSNEKILLIFDPNEQDAQNVFFHRCLASLRKIKK